MALLLLWKFRFRNFYYIKNLLFNVLFFLFYCDKKRKKRTKRKRKYATTSYALTSVKSNGCSGFSVGRCRALASKPVSANNMKITRKIRKDLLLLKCYARPNNPRQQAKLALSRLLSQLIAARSRRDCRSVLFFLFLL